MIYIRYHSISSDSASASVEKQKTCCFCPPNLWVGNLRIFSLQKTGNPKAIQKLIPIESLLRGNNCFVLNEKKNSHFCSKRKSPFHSSDSQHLEINLPSKSSDTALEKCGWKVGGFECQRLNAHCAKNYSHSTTISDMDFSVFSQQKMPCRGCLHQSCLTPEGSGGGFCGITRTSKNRWGTKTTSFSKKSLEILEMLALEVQMSLEKTQKKQFRF